MEEIRALNIAWNIRSQNSRKTKKFLRNIFILKEAIELHKAEKVLLLRIN